ncbi:MAG: aminoacetone oxidase family FAD-binding enzyme, partial [Clostridia bacterium]|nr:aminoacetone oxidase family FAD-binding enzyme [Clostridia bacterium]
KATDIVLALKSFVLNAGAKIINERVAALIQNGNRIAQIKTENKIYSDFDDVLLCTGGLSYPLTGSTGDGYKFAEKLGHTISTPIPSLIGLESEDKLCRDCQGLALKNVAITVTDTSKSKVVYKDFGEMLFTHFGLSGPMILSASAHLRPMEKGKFVINIDLKPALDAKTLDQRILSDFEKYKNKNIENSLSDLLPNKLIHPFIHLCNIAYDRKVNTITKAERETMLNLFKSLPVTVRGFRPIEEAIITSGGIKTNEIDPKTMKSKLIDNLYFAGEIIDVDAYTGGFNLQIAFSTAVTAAYSILEN